MIKSRAFFLFTLVLSVASSIASAATVSFNSTECPSCTNVVPVVGNEWSSYGLSVSQAYWYIDNRDTFDTMGLSVNIDPATISFATASTNATIDWFVIGGFSGTYTAYDSDNNYLDQLFVDVSDADQLGTYTFVGQVSSLVWSGTPGFAQISTLTFTAAVPEPEIYAMLGVGLGLMGWVGRRRKLQAA